MYELMSKEWVENILQESARWKALLKAGKLSKSALRRIQKLSGKGDPLYIKQLLKDGKKEQAKEYLKKRGIIKSARDWLAGVERGTQNILKKVGAKETKKFGTSFAAVTGVKPMGGKKFSDPLRAHTQISQKGKITVHTPSQVPKKKQALSTVIKRHEAEEAKAGRKMWKTRRGRVMPAATVGPGHFSDAVIKAEKELTDMSSALYGKKFNKPGNLKTLLKYRDKTKEYEKIKGISKKDIKKTLNRVDSDIKSNMKYIKTMTDPVKKQVLKSIQPFLSKNELEIYKKRINFKGPITAKKLRVKKI